MASKHQKLVRISNIFVAVAIGAVLVECGSLENLAKHEFADGYYTLKSCEIPVTKVFAEISDDSIHVYPLANNGLSRKPEKSNATAVSLTEISPGGYLYGSTFSRTYLEVDLIAILFKYRPSHCCVPPQLNSNINAAAYLGYKADKFKINTNISPLGRPHSQIQNFSYDGGIFAGIGVTPINPTVTLDRVAQEYDGIVFQKGVAVFVGTDFINIGLACGFDNLLDMNKKKWIYNQKPWFGFSIGIANF